MALRKVVRKDKISDGGLLFVYLSYFNDPDHVFPQGLGNLTRNASWPCAAASDRMASCLN